MSRWLASSLPDRTSSSLFLQLRVIRAFKSTLEDLEERRSVHSLHSLHSMRSSRSHTGPRPLSDFTYIDEDPTNTALNAGKGLQNKMADHSNDHSAARNQSVNSSTSPLLLSVTGPGNAYHHHHNTTINTTNDNRSSSNNALNQAHQPNHTQMQSSNNNRDSNNTGNSLLLSSNNLALPEWTKLVIGGELQERLIPVPYSKSSTDQAVSAPLCSIFLTFAKSLSFSIYLSNGFRLQIRVVNAFRQGTDPRYRSEHSSNTLGEVLKQSKRLSQTSSIEYADNNPNELPIPIDVERLSSHSHTETAV
ncbi:hypothetical protein WH47_01584 [Habropoda laboriosa]|uniref:Uncharacterized protein n=1 Tax=Habropoda laboriosa TaxID=597456 RepID=A0A0L7R0U4_9HYME|nr:hypothetical protein WH47_01584 [Habropoda laboriosa]